MRPRVLVHEREGYSFAAVTFDGSTWEPITGVRVLEQDWPRPDCRFPQHPLDVRVQLPRPEVVAVLNGREVEAFTIEVVAG